MAKYEVVIIGSGPGGYVGAIRCSQLGKKTAIVERYTALGGTCLNVGCIPSKALLDSSELFYQAQHRFSAHGIVAGDLSVDFKTMVNRKAEVVAQTVEGVKFLMKKNKIDVFTGVGSFIDTKTILVTKEDGSTETISAEKIIIATGSKPAPLKGVTIDKKRIITSTEALTLTEIPKQLLIIGGGVIGLELGSVYARLGSTVSVVEYADSIIPTMDRSLGKELKKSLEKIGFTFYLNYGVTGVSAKGKTVTLKATSSKDQKEIELTGDYCLLSVGRVPNTENLALENCGVQKDERGRIVVSDQLETTTPGIYAIGDVIKGAMLAHKAEEEGMFVAEVIAGQKPHINYLLIPGVVYTWPEVAAVGYTEEELKTAGRKFKTGSFPFKASGRARASMDLEGFIKVLADHETDEILGVHMIGPRVADMIAEAVVAMEFKASAEDIARTSHAHPTYTEVFREACLAASDNRAIHS
jgi:dihydrolipoamide dehydrogenase